MNSAPTVTRWKSQRATRLSTAPPLAQQIALVTGANRGLGLEVVRQLAATGMTVLLGSRKLDLGERAAQALRYTGADVVAVKLDVTRPEDINAAARLIENSYGRLDVLVNNAGGYYDVNARPTSISLDTVQAALDLNLFGAWRMNEAMLPLMRVHGFGRIVNVSSGCGSSTIDGDTCPAYRVSKAALNMYTRTLAAELEGSGILINAVCPGWTATDMGGPGGRAIGDGAEGIVWAACLSAKMSMNGLFFRDRQPMAW